MAEAMMQSRDYSHARQELERVLLLSDKLGMQPLSARAHYLLATIARDSGDRSEARDNYREALRLLDAMKKDPGAEKLYSAWTSRPSTMSPPAEHKQPKARTGLTNGFLQGPFLYKTS